MPDPLDQDALGRQWLVRRARVAGFAFRAAELHLDEFVVMQGAFRFRDDGGRDPGLPMSSTGFNA